MTRQTAREIEQQAADWAARVDRGLSPDEQSELDRWLAADSRRIGAFGRIRAIALQTERVAALGPLLSPGEFVSDERAMPRRRLLAGGGVAIALAALGAIGWHRLRGDLYETRKGEARQLALDDGSVVSLNTETELAVKLLDDRREVTMLGGEALFDVARDPTRPFLIALGATQVRVLGTSFLVRALPGRPVEVLVREGVVEVQRTDVAGLPRRLTANMRAVSQEAARGASAGILVADVPNGTVTRALAWRDGDIDFEGETLAQAVGEFARYSDTRIDIDPAVANEQIAGVYQANNPVGFAHSVAGSLRARVIIGDGVIQIVK